MGCIQAVGVSGRSQEGCKGHAAGKPTARRTPEFRPFAKGPTPASSGTLLGCAPVFTYCCTRTRVPGGTLRPMFAQRHPGVANDNKAGAGQAIAE